MSNPLGELISKGEGDYVSYNRGTLNGRILPADSPIDLTQMSIEEVMRRQSLPKSDSQSMFAVGKYQWIPRTMRETVAGLDIDPSETLSASMQEHMFANYLIREKRPQIHDYIVGKEHASLHSAQKAACLEWASVEDPDTPGHVFSKYESSGNRMHTRASDVATVLNEMRNEYKANIERGLSAEESWTATISMGPGSLAKDHGFGKYDLKAEQVQRNLNTLGIRDADRRELVVDGDRGGPDSRTNQAIAAFQQRFGLQGELTDSELVVATQAALHARRALDFESSLQGIVPTAASRDFTMTEPRSPHAATSPAGDHDNTAVTPAETVRLPPMPQVSSLQPGERGAAVFALQEHLRLLNARDAHGQPLKADREYGDRTRAAVENFQLWTGLSTTGVADRATLDALETHAAFALEQRARGVPPGEHLTDNLKTGMPAPTQPITTEREAWGRDANEAPAASVSTPIPMPYGDPAHPKHALYVEAKAKLVELGYQLPDERLHQVVAQMDLNGMRAGPQNRYAVRSDNNTVYVVSDIPGFRAHQNLDAPAPSVAGTMQHVQTEQLAQAAERERWAQMSRMQSAAQGSPGMSLGPVP